MKYYRLIVRVLGINPRQINIIGARTNGVWSSDNDWVVNRQGSKYVAEAMSDVHVDKDDDISRLLEDIAHTIESVKYDSIEIRALDLIKAPYQIYRKENVCPAGRPE